MWVFFFNQSNINSVRDLYVLKTKDCVKCNSGIMIFFNLDETLNNMYVSKI